MFLRSLPVLEIFMPSHTLGKLLRRIVRAQFTPANFGCGETRTAEEQAACEHDHCWPQTMDAGVGTHCSRSPELLRAVREKHCGEGLFEKSGQLVLEAERLQPIRRGPAASIHSSQTAWTPDIDGQRRSPWARLLFSVAGDVRAFRRV